MEDPLSSACKSHCVIHPDGEVIKTQPFFLFNPEQLGQEAHQQAFGVGGME